MKQKTWNNSKIGILGGGQLGKMLALAGGNMHLDLHFLDTSKDFPAGPYTANFHEGDFRNYDDVLAFGQKMDLISIEIENVNSEALFDLEKEGITIHPRPEALRLIKDKGLQKQVFEMHGFPTADFELYNDQDAIKTAVQKEQLSLPFVQKARTEGYDGRGVKVVREAADLEQLLEGPSLVEHLVPIKKELSVIAARNKSGEILCYPTVEMVFNSVANLVEYLFAPAKISAELEQQAAELAKKVIQAFDVCGLLAVEMFLDDEDRLLVNEVAPRPHNSGHHTIESAHTSQFEQHLRAILNWPLGSTELLNPAVMVNLLGEPGSTGPAIYDGLEEVLAIPGVHVHIYGKTISKPFRKMGHVTIVDKELDKAIEKAEKVKMRLNVYG